MIYLVITLILISGYYTLTYGISVWKNENNALGGMAVITLATLATVISVIFLIVRA
jgi:hypothetical protein